MQVQKGMGMIMQQGIGIIKRKNPHGVRVIPGFGLTLGVSVTMLSCLVLIPLASIIWSAGRLSFSEFIQVVTSRQILSGYQVSLTCAFVAALINVIFGIVLAWVLVRYEFPGKRILDGMIELPFALPTAVAGISLTTVLGSGLDRFLICQSRDQDRLYQSRDYDSNDICRYSVCGAVGPAGAGKV